VQKESDSSFNDVLAEMRTAGANDPAIGALCDQLWWAHSRACGDAFMTGSQAALDHLVLGIRYDESDADQVEWYEARRNERIHWEGRHDHRQDIRRWVADRATERLGTSVELRHTIDEVLAVADRIGGREGRELREDALAWEPLAAPKAHSVT
jgi:hypothetical protein